MNQGTHDLLGPRVPTRHIQSFLWFDYQQPTKTLLSGEEGCCHEARTALPFCRHLAQPAKWPGNAQVHSERFSRASNRFYGARDVVKRCASQRFG